jgi:hypothetical protein
MTNLRPDLTSIVVRTLVATDTVWLPYRYGPHNSGAAWTAAAAIEDRRRQFATRGVPMLGAGTAATRMAFMRQLGELRQLGLLRLITHHGRRFGAKLTPLGDDYARTLTGGYTVAESFPLLELVESATIKNCEYSLELAILGIEYGQVADTAPLVDLENRLLPLLARGWLESNCGGYVGYRVTAAGKVATLPDSSADLPTYDQAAADEYDELFTAALREREQWRPETHNIAIPLPRGNWLPTEGANACQPVV